MAFTKTRVLFIKVKSKFTIVFVHFPFFISIFISEKQNWWIIPKNFYSINCLLSNNNFHNAKCMIWFQKSKKVLRNELFQIWNDVTRWEENLIFILIILEIDCTLIFQCYYNFNQKYQRALNINENLNLKVAF